MPLYENKIGGIRKKLARAMVGCTVDLLDERHTVAHGVVTGILLTAGTPKIIVNGQRYGMEQVLTATAASIP
ncbi:MAG TPA: hypothetical protein VFD66_06985 [Verrucomicrobiae bacterium]|nr:hypothetical protein [Verrucomicrobiae bacterium]